MTITNQNYEIVHKFFKIQKLEVKVIIQSQTT